MRYSLPALSTSRGQQFVSGLRRMVKKMCCDTIHPLSKKLLSSVALLRSMPMSVPYFYSRKIQGWIDGLLDCAGIDAVFCSSSPTAEYLFRSRHYNGTLKRLPWIIDLIDVDSYKWEQYAERSGRLMRPVYHLEARCLKKYEERIASEFDRVLLVSEAERTRFLDRVSTANSKAVMNGVDQEYFSPAFRSGLPKNGPVLAFSGVMDYRPNIDGVEWFVKDVLTRIQKVFPDLIFYIVGARPTSSVRLMAQKYPGVKVTGYVDDIRTYLAGADVCVVPLRIARGIQNKVLEAMAMGKAVVCTQHALEGIPAESGKDLMKADGEEGFADAVIELLGDRTHMEKLGRQARAFTENHFSWKRNLAPLDAIFHSERPASANAG